MLQLATLLPTPHGVRVSEADVLWEKVVYPFLRTLGYGSDLLLELPTLERRTDTTRPLYRLLYHSPPAHATPADLLLTVSLSRLQPGELLDECIARAWELRVVPPLVAMVHPQRSGFVLAAFHTLTRMPIGMAFPGPAQLKTLAAGLRNVTESETSQRVDVAGLRQALLKARVEDHPDQELRLLVALGSELQSQQRYGEAAEVLEQLLLNPLVQGEPAHRVQASLELARVLRLNAQLERASEQLEGALQVLHDHGLSPGPASMALHSELAAIALDRDELEASRAHLREALELARTSRDLSAQGALLNNLAHIDRREGRLEPAAAHLEQALEITRSLGQPREELLTQHNLAVIYRQLGREQVTQRMVKEVRRLSEGLRLTVPLESGDEDHR